MSNSSANPSDLRPIILLTGATGYVGGRLLQNLESAGQRLRCLARNPATLRSKVAEATELVAGDVLDSASLRAAMEGAHTAYYLVHLMGSNGDFASLQNVRLRVKQGVPLAFR
jgi:uncharacterized protein YbjT (DUF2867 family)